MKFIVSSELLIKKLQVIIQKTLPEDIPVSANKTELFIAETVVQGVGDGYQSGSLTMKELIRLYSILIYIQDQPITLIFDGRSFTLNGIML